MLLSNKYTFISTPATPFPMSEDTPVAAIDFDNTLAKYAGWKGSDHVGKPRKNAIWALECFKHNGWEVEIFTSRKDTEPVWAWIKHYAHGLIQRVNETRDHSGEKAFKPKADIFIDDRSEYWIGRELDWVEVMERLKRRGFMPNGLSH